MDNQIPVQDEVVLPAIDVPSPDQPTPVIPTDPDAIQQQAFKATVAHPAWAEVDTQQAIQEGRMPQLRKEAAAFQDARRFQETQDLIQKAAQYKGSPLTPDEHKFMLDKAIITQLQGLSVPTDPETVLEEYYAGNYLKTSTYDVANRLPDGFMAAAIKEQPRMVQQTVQNASALMTKQELLRNKIIELEELRKNQSWFGWGVDLAKEAIPFYFQTKMRQGGLLGDGALLGANVREQGKDLYRLPLPEFKERLKVLDRLAQDNPGIAVQLAQSMLGMSDNDQLLYDLITPLEFTGFGAVGRAVASRVLRAGQVATATRDVLKAANGTVTKATIPEAAGDMVEATVQRTMQVIKDEINGAVNPQTRALESLPSYFRNMAWNYGMNRGGGSREMMNRVEQNMDMFAEKLQNIMQTVQRVARIPSVLETEDALRAVQKDIKEFYPKRFISDMSPIQHEPFTNTYSVQVSMHRPDGQLFRSEEVARNYARDPSGLARPDARVVQEGQGFKLVFDHQLRETDPVIRNLLIPAPTAAERPTAAGTIRSYIDMVRNPSDVNTAQNKLNRKVSVYAGAELEKLFKEQGDYIRDLSRGIIRHDPVTGTPIPSYVARPLAFGKRFLKGELFSKSEQWNQWESVVKFSNEARDPATNKPGYFFQQQGELEGHYLRHFNRMPDPVETEAYFAMRNLREGGRVAENLGVLTKKLRLGAESHQVYFLKEDGTKVASPSFEGVVRKNTIPANNEPWMLLGTQEGMEHVYGPGNPIPPTVRKHIEGQIKKGVLKVIEVLEPGKRPLQGFGNAGDFRIRYVVAPYAETKQLSFEQIPLSGAFREFPYEFTVGQAIVKSEQLGGARLPTHWYEGDRHAAGFMVRAEGGNYAKHMNEIQRLIRENKLDEAKAYSNKHMTRDWDEIKKAFDDGTYSLTEPFHVISRNKKIIDGEKASLEARYMRRRDDKDGRMETTLRDGTRTGIFAGQTSVFGDDLSDVMHVRDIGTRNNPVFDNSPAKVIDPIPSNDRALTKLVNSLFMDDYKTSSIEHWIKQAEPYLTATPHELNSAPYYHFHNPIWKSDVDKAIIRDLETQKRNMEQLVGTPSVLQDGLHRVAQKLFDAHYEGGGRHQWITPEWLLPKVTDPAQFIRSVTFHATMGFFNIAQMALNLNTFVNIFAIAGPKFASQGTAGAFLHGLASINKNPAILQTLDRIAQKIGWRPGEWIESMSALDQTGFKHVTGTHILKDNQIGPQTFAGASHDFLDMGTYFWKKSEKVVRIGAWHTAWKEFRDTKPFGRVTTQDIAKVLDRADFLAAEMSRASASTMHTGVMSIPSQFFAYPIRIAESFWSEARMGAFNSAQGIKTRARMLATYALAYGVPGAIGITGVPLYDHIRQSALDNGYNPGDNFLRTLFHEGLPATAIGLATGNYYNISDRYALQGVEVFKDMLREDKSFLSILGGAAGSKLASLFESASPFAKFTMGFISGEGVRPSADHALDIFKEIASVNNLVRTAAAINTGKWMSKKDVFLEGKTAFGGGKEISVPNALFMAITGLAPTSANDLYALSLNKKSQEETMKVGGKLFVREWRRMYKAASENDYEGAARFRDNAYYALKVAGVPEHKWSGLMAQAIENINKSMREQVDWDRLVRDAPPEKRQQNLEIFQRIMQQRNSQ